MNAGETHFDRHRYAIRAYIFDPKSRIYTERVRFDTQQKYSGGDGDPINALEVERPTIVAKLRQEHPN
jgi:hypothetical protein